MSLYLVFVSVSSASSSSSVSVILPEAVQLYGSGAQPPWTMAWLQFSLDYLLRCNGLFFFFLLGSGWE